MTVLKVNESVSGRPKNSIGEAYAQQIISNWNGTHVADACVAATQLGLIHSGGVLSYERAKTILREAFNLRKVDDVNWSVVNEAFQNGRSAVINPTQLKERFSPTPANDNKLQLPAGIPLKDRFNVTWFDDVDKSPAKEWIVKDVIGAGEFSLWVAKPGTAKSALLCDIGCHIAAGLDWHGRKVKPGLAIFFAAERKAVTERRVAAWAKRHGVTGIPFAVVGGKLDLTNGLIDAKALAIAIKQCEQKSGLPCHLVILDTVTRTFGAGDQNSSKDMQRFIKSADELTLATGAHVAAIHHSGWVGDRGKGAVDLDGAVDVSFGIDVVGTGPTKVFTLKNTGANDGQEGQVTAFKLESVDLGTDADGNVTTAPVVVPADASKQDGSNLKGNAGKALDALRHAINEDGESPPDASPGFPEGIVAARRDVWRNRFYADAWIKEPDATEDALSRRFRRAITELQETKAIGECGQWFWLDMDKAGHGQK